MTHGYRTRPRPSPVDTTLNCYLFIEYATSAGHHKNMCTHRNEKKDTKHSGKKHTHIKTL